MKLNDSPFLTRPSEPMSQMSERRPLTARQKQLLRGVGDRHLRGLHYIANRIAAEPEPISKWKPGQPVEFITPDRIVRQGRLIRRGEAGWYVRIDDGEIAVVPEGVLQKSAADIVTAIRDQLRGSVSKIWETRKPIVINASGDFKITLQHNSLDRVSDEDVLNYLAERYPGARVLDADDRLPGIMSVILAFENKDFTQSGPQQTGTENRPGVVEEEIEGTGHIAGPVMDDVDVYDELVTAAHETAQKFAKANPGIVVVPAETEKSFGEPDNKEAIVRMGFALQSDEHDPLFIDPSGDITNELSVETIPARGYIYAKLTGDHSIVLLGPDGEAKPEAYGLKSARVEEPYATGNGPLSTRRDYPEGRTEPTVGDYYIKAEEDKEAKSPATDEDDGDVREVLEPQRVDDGKFESHKASDKETNEYFSKLFGPYGEMLTRDIPRRKHEEQSYRAKVRREAIIDSWLHHNKCEPTAEEFLATLSVVKQSFKPRILYAEIRKANKGVKKYGQEFGRMTPSELAAGLMEQSGMLPGIEEELEKVVIDYLSKNREAIKFMVDDMRDELKTRVLSLAIGSNNRLYKNLTKAYDKNQQTIQQGPKKTWREKGRELFLPSWQKELEEESRSQLWQREMETRRKQKEPEALTGLTPLEQKTQQKFKEMMKGLEKSKAGPAPTPAAPTPQEKAPVAPPAAPAQEAPTPQEKAPVAPPTPQKKAPVAPPAVPKEEVPPVSEAEKPEEKPVPTPPKKEEKQDITAPPVQPVRPGMVPFMAKTVAAEVAKELGIEEKKVLKELEGAILDLHRKRKINLQSTSIPDLVKKIMGEVTKPGTAEPEEESPTAAKQAQKAKEHQAPLSKHDMRFCVSKQWASGNYGYMHLIITWDTSMCEGMSAGNIRHQVISFVKKLESNPEYHDYGALGKPRFREFDPKAGMAEVIVRSSESRAVPSEYVHEHGSENKVNRM